MLYIVYVCTMVRTFIYRTADKGTVIITILIIVIVIKIL